MLDPDIEAFYNRGLEASRLEQRAGPVELARTQELLRRFLPPPPAVVLDVGGGTGIYSRWLASLGYAVHLIDPVPLHLEQARSEPGAAALASISRGDARRLEQPDQSAAAVMLCGPLYHLPERRDRLEALREARRAVMPGGLVFAAGISRFAPIFSGLTRKLLDDPAAQSLIDGVLDSGEHCNPTRHPDYFTTAFFHHPEELPKEAEEAGLKVEGLFAVEGPASILPDLGFYWDEPKRREQLLGLLRRVEEEPSLLGLSNHILAVLTRPQA